MSTESVHTPEEIAALEKGHEDYQQEINREAGKYHLPAENLVHLDAEMENAVREIVQQAEAAPAEDIRVSRERIEPPNILTSYSVRRWT